MLKGFVSAALIALSAIAHSGAAQAQDTSRNPVCASYGKAAADWERKAMAQGCKLSFPNQITFNGNDGAAYAWCMGTSDASFRGRSPQALGHKANLERLCGAQLRRPFALAASAAPAAGKPSIDTRREYYEARWVWVGVYKASMDAGNTSKIQFNTPTQAVYCYNSGCRIVTVRKGVGGSLDFTSDSKNYFEFNPGGDPTRINARFWVDFKPPARSPDATATFVRKP